MTRKPGRGRGRPEPKILSEERRNRSKKKKLEHKQNGKQSRQKKKLGKKKKKKKPNTGRKRVRLKLIKTVVVLKGYEGNAGDEMLYPGQKAQGEFLGEKKSRAKEKKQKGGKNFGMGDD